MTKVRIDFGDDADVRAMYGGPFPPERQRLRRVIASGLPLAAMLGAGDDQRRAHTPVRCP